MKFKKVLIEADISCGDYCSEGQEECRFLIVNYDNFKEWDAYCMQGLGDPEKTTDGEYKRTKNCVSKFGK